MFGTELTAEGAVQPVRKGLLGLQGAGMPSRSMLPPHNDDYCSKDAATTTSKMRWFSL